MVSEGRADYRGVTGDEFSRRISSGFSEIMVTVSDRRGKFGGKLYKFTGSAVVALVCLGTVWRGRTSATNFGDSRKKTTAFRRFTAFRRRVRG